MADGSNDDGFLDLVDQARDSTEALSGSARNFSAAMTRAFTQATAGGRALDDVLKSLALRMSSLAVAQAFRPISDNIVGGLGNVLPGVFGGGGSSARGASDFGAPASNVTVNVATPDIGSFRRSESYLAGQVARAVARGQRTL
jgi:phage-related minor tail protein